jgi:hypothetical protein
MKNLLLIAAVAGSVWFCAGCATPAYTPDERQAQINRNLDFEGKQSIDDFDNAILMRPATHLTLWNLR